MSRLPEISEQDATGLSAELFATMKKKMGKVPNTYRLIGGHTPEILALALQHDALLHKGSLTAKELEAINVTSSYVTGCDYCLAAHQMMAKRAGYSLEQIHAIRNGSYPDDARIDALVKFVRLVVMTHGTLPQADVSALLNAGYDARQVIEILSATSAILFTNMVNRVNDTEVDFPKAE